jgi:CBS domain-containing protein
MAMEGSAPIFAMTNLQQPPVSALCFYILLGGLMGLIAVGVTRAVYFIEDGFEKLPIHWMWWPALGGLAVGIVGWLAPNTLGVGYYNIRDMLAHNLTVGAIAFLCAMKFISWSISLGSGTSGGTLAPLFTIGGGMGAVVGSAFIWLAPNVGIDVRIAALVGMASLFAGASRAMLASVVFAFETTLQPLGLLPLLGGCAASYLISTLLMRTSIMTEKIERRGIRAPAEYLADSMAHVLVRDVASRGVVTLKASDTVRKTRAWIASNVNGTSHQGFPILDESQMLVGVLTRRDFLGSNVSENQTLGQLIGRSPKFVYDDCTVREAADHMVNHGIGRLPVVQREGPPKVTGMISRSDVLSVFQHQIRDGATQKPTISVRLPRIGRKRQKRQTPKAS